MRTKNPVQVQENERKKNKEKCDRFVIPLGKSTFSTKHLRAGSSPDSPYGKTLSPNTPYIQLFKARVPSIPTLCPTSSST